MFKAKISCVSFSKLFRFPHKLCLVCRKLWNAPMPKPWECSPFPTQSTLSRLRRQLVHLPCPLGFLGEVRNKFHCRQQPTSWQMRQTLGKTIENNFIKCQAGKLVPFPYALGGEDRIHNNERVYPRVFWKCSLLMLSDHHLVSGKRITETCFSHFQILQKR